AGLLDLSLREWVVIAPLLLLIGLMGLMPQPFLDPARQPVDRLLSRFAQVERRLQDADPARTPTTGSQPPAVAGRE
ncbi:MAG TPA: Fe-S-binding domain-containing protein, partial [Anaeromyxobacteraceae bacterium]